MNHLRLKASTTLAVIYGEEERSREFELLWAKALEIEMKTLGIFGKRDSGFLLVERMRQFVNYDIRQGRFYEAEQLICER